MAKTLGMDIVYIYPLRSKGVFTTATRYILSTVYSFWILLVNRPKVVFCLNQPMALLTVTYIYCLIFRATYGVDAHSKPYGWKINGLRRRTYDFFARHAHVVVNHNKEDLEASKGAGATAYLLPVVLNTIEYREIPVSRSEDFVLVSSSFAADEPVELIFDAARQVPDTEFRITGNSTRCSNEVLRAMPDNVTLLGFVSRDEYYSQMVAASGVVTLSTRSHIMQMAAEESMCLECALITNKSPILETVFGDGAIFVELNSKCLSDAIKQLLSDTSGRRLKMIDAKNRYKKTFDKAMTDIVKILH